MAGEKRHSQDKIETKYSLEWNVTEFRLLGVTFSVDLNNMSKLNFDPLIDLFIWGFTSLSTLYRSYHDG